MREGMLRLTVKDGPEVKMIEKMHHDFLTQQHPQDGAVLSDANGNQKQVFGMAMYSPTMYVRDALGGIEAWRDQVLTAKTEELKKSCVFLTITMQFEVKVIVNGVEVSTEDGQYALPTVEKFDAREKKAVQRPSQSIQQIIAHYHKLGINRFAYLGARCLKASLTTATLTADAHFITMYVLCMPSGRAKLDQMTQLFGRANTDMGDYVLCGPEVAGTSAAPQLSSQSSMSTAMSSDAAPQIPFQAQGDCYWMEALFRSKEPSQEAVQLEDGGKDSMDRPLLRYPGSDPLDEKTVLKYDVPTTTAAGTRLKTLYFENRSAHFTWVLANDQQLNRMQQYVQVEFGLCKHWEKDTPLDVLVHMALFGQQGLMGTVGNRGNHIEHFRKGGYPVPKEVVELLEKWMKAWQDHHDAKQVPRPGTILGITYWSMREGGDKLFAKNTMTDHKISIEMLFKRGLLLNVDELEEDLPEGKNRFDQMFPGQGKKPDSDVPRSTSLNVQQRWRYLFPSEAAFAVTNEVCALEELLPCEEDLEGKEMLSELTLAGAKLFERVNADTDASSGDYRLKFKYIGDRDLTSDEILFLNGRPFYNRLGDPPAEGADDDEDDDDDDDRKGTRKDTDGDMPLPAQQRILTVDQKKHALKALPYFKEFLRGMPPPPEGQGRKGVPFYYRKPAGKPRKGKTWNFQTGEWDEDPNPPKKPPKPAKDVAMNDGEAPKRPGAWTYDGDNLDQADKQIEKQLKAERKLKRKGLPVNSTADEESLHAVASDPKSPRQPRQTRHKNPDYTSDLQSSLGEEDSSEGENSSSVDWEESMEMLGDGHEDKHDGDADEEDGLVIHSHSKASKAKRKVVRDDEDSDEPESANPKRPRT